MAALGPAALDDAPPGRPSGIYAEVWGDTVDLRHLGRAVLIGGAISLACFLVANRVLAGFVARPDIARTYAMLAGLIGCLVGGGVCAVLFAPKREFAEHAAGDPWREEALAQLVAETGPLGSTARLSGPVVQELRELGLYDLFAAHDVPETRRAAPPGAPAAAGSRP